MIKPSSRRAPQFVETLESRQFLSGTGCDDTALLSTTPAAAGTKAIVVEHALKKAAKPAASPGKAIWGEAKAGVVLKFKKAKSLPGNGIFGFVHESGTFTDEKKGTGTYELVIPPKLSSTQPVQVLNLTFKTAKIQRSLTIQFTPASKRLNNGLNGKTVTFVKTAAGASAKAVQMANVGLKITYMKY